MSVVTRMGGVMAATGPVRQERVGTGRPSDLAWAADGGALGRIRMSWVAEAGPARDPGKAARRRFWFGFSRSVPRGERARLAIDVPARPNEEEIVMQSANRLAFTVSWEVSEGNVARATDIIARFVPEARKEPGLLFFTVNQSASDPSQFLFYEIFEDAAAFALHQETPHFREMIIEQALPLLKARQRVEYRTM